MDEEKKVEDLLDVIKQTMCDEKITISRDDLINAQSIAIVKLMNEKDVKVDFLQLTYFGTLVQLILFGDLKVELESEGNENGNTAEE